MTIDEIMNMFRGYLDTDWRTKTQCINWLRNIFKCDINERELRDTFARYCQDYVDGKHDSFLAHSSRGYLLTSDPKIIKASIRDDESRMFSLARRIYGVKNRLKNEDQITLLPQDNEAMDAYEILSKMEV
ncbi:MAG: hypothetical protein IKO38_07265 [Erysipelotrichaceae bacterium]|nr:hypothetical protein [Erysipelotrichaceae bacterium]